MTERQTRVEAKLRRAAQAVHDSLVRRDELIREAAASGLSYRRIAALTGLTFGRIGQIVRADRPVRKAA